jgi:hypothetical protein
VHIFKGDIVDTPYGKGIVTGINTWRDKIIEMHDWRADEFSQECLREVGENYQSTWAEVFVRVKGILYRVISNQIEVIRGRDDKGKSKIGA